MDTTGDVSEAWGEELRAFLGSEQRLLHVTVDEQTRPGVLASWYACMKERPSGQLFFVVQGPALGARGWDLRADELYAQYEHLRRVLERTGGTIAPLGDDVRPLPDRTIGLSRFATILGRVDAGLAARRGALVIVMAPLFDVSSDASWQDDLRALIDAAARCARVRLAITELAPGPSAARLRSASAQVCSVRLDPVVIRRELVERLHAQASAPPGATGFRATGAAGPKVAPPPRPGRMRAPLDPEVLRALDPEARLALDRVAQAALRRSSALAIARAAEGDMVGALEPQASVVRTCEQAGATASAASHMLVLGALTAAAGSAERARSVCLKAHASASACGAEQVALQALLFLASIEMSQGCHLEAAARYRQVAQGARAMSDTIMAIEGLRACGEALLACDRPADAITTWREALAIARQADRTEAKLSAAPALARRLAALCRRSRLEPQAREYDLIAAELASSEKEPS